MRRQFTHHFSVLIQKLQMRIAAWIDRNDEAIPALKIFQLKRDGTIIRAAQEKALL